MNKRLLLLLNPAAGQRRANRLLPEIVRVYNDCGYECIVYVTSGCGDATRFIKEHACDYGRIVCIGGDGTLNEVIAGLVESGISRPIGYIPAGTTNDYARSLGLSTDILQAARDAVEGVPCYFDLGSFNGRQFIYTAACGAFTRAPYTTSQTAKNLLGHLAYVLEGIKDLPSLKPIHLRMENGDSVVEGDYIFCAVTNTLSVGGILKLRSDVVRLNDGLFEVMLVHFPTQPAHLSKILMALRANDMPSDLIEFFTADRLQISVRDEIEWTLDGERSGAVREIELLNLYKRLQLVLPREAVNTVPVEAENLPVPADMVMHESEDQLSN